MRFVLEYVHQEVNSSGVLVSTMMDVAMFSCDGLTLARECAGSTAPVVLDLYCRRNLGRAPVAGRDRVAVLVCSWADWAEDREVCGDDIIKASWKEKGLSWKDVRVLDKYSALPQGEAQPTVPT